MTTKLDAIDWAKITMREARTLIAPAARREARLAQIWEKDSTPENMAAWNAAMKTEEDLRVFAICGVRPQNN